MTPAETASATATPPHTTPPPDPPPAAAQPSPAVLRSRAVAFASCAALVVLGLAWELWLAPTGRGTLAVKVLPIALALPGLWRLRMYTYRWVSLAVWLYVCEGLVRGSSDAGLSVWLAWGEVALGVLLFVACVLHVRARLRGGRLP